MKASTLSRFMIRVFSSMCQSFFVGIKAKQIRQQCWMDGGSHEWQKIKAGTNIGEVKYGEVAYRTKIGRNKAGTRQGRNIIYMLVLHRTDFVYFSISELISIQSRN